MISRAVDWRRTDTDPQSRNFFRAELDDDLFEAVVTGRASVRA